MLLLSIKLCSPVRRSTTHLLNSVYIHCIYDFVCFSKWFLKKLGPEGIYKMLNAWDDKSGYALCTFAYHSGEADGKVILFRGKCEVQYEHSHLMF